MLQDASHQHSLHISTKQARNRLGKGADFCVPNLEIFHDPAPLKSLWLAFETKSVGTVFQSYAWCEAWVRCSASKSGEKPVILVGWDELGELLFIWPMSISSFMGTSILEWMGQYSSYYSFGLTRRDYLLELGADQLENIFTVVKLLVPEISMLHFRNQPRQWEGVENPFLALSEIPSANDVLALSIEEDFLSFYEKTLRSRRRKDLQRKLSQLEKSRDVDFGFAQEEAEQKAVFEAFLHQKGEQFARQGTTNIFSQPLLRDFYQDLSSKNSLKVCYPATQEAGNMPKYLLQQAYLKVDGQIIATCSGVQQKDRFYLLTSSIYQGELGKYSPGILLFKYVLESKNAQGVRHIEFGSGEGRHKGMWKVRPILLFETFLSLETKSVPVKTLLSSSVLLKRFVRESQLLRPVGEALRKMKRQVRKYLQATS